MWRNLKKISVHTKAKHSISCSSGTAAICIRAIGLKDDNIIIPSKFYCCSEFIKKNRCKYFLRRDKNSGQMTPDDLLDC